MYIRENTAGTGRPADPGGVMPSCAFDIDGFSRQPGVSELCCWLPAPLVLIQFPPHSSGFQPKLIFAPPHPTHTVTQSLCPSDRMDGSAVHLGPGLLQTLLSSLCLFLACLWWRRNMNLRLSDRVKQCTTELRRVFDGHLAGRTSESCKTGGASYQDVMRSTEPVAW